MSCLQPARGRSPLRRPDHVVSRSAALAVSARCPWNVMLEAACGRVGRFGWSRLAAGVASPTQHSSRRGRRGRVVAPLLEPCTPGCLPMPPRQAERRPWRTPRSTAQSRRRRGTAKLILCEHIDRPLVVRSLRTTAHHLVKPSTHATRATACAAAVEMLAPDRGTDQECGGGPRGSRQECTVRARVEQQTPSVWMLPG
jgi:hypothetical protein